MYPLPHRKTAVRGGILRVLHEIRPLPHPNNHKSYEHLILSSFRMIISLLLIIYSFLFPSHLFLSCHFFSFFLSFL